MEKRDEGVQWCEGCPQVSRHCALHRFLHNSLGKKKVIQVYSQAQQMMMWTTEKKRKELEQ